MVKDLTDEQKKFLEECENEFKDRYTEKDADFMKTKNGEASKPPIVSPWGARRRPMRDWRRQRQHNRFRDNYQSHSRYNDRRSRHNHSDY